MAGNPTIIQVEWPEGPKFRITEDQEAFDRFYFQLKTVLSDQLQTLADKVDEKADAT